MQLRRRHFPNTVITKNQATQKFYINFFIDNSNANISLYTLSFPDFNLGQLKVQYALDLRKILGVAKKFLKSRSFLFQTEQNP